MKSYPSIPRATGTSFREFHAEVWDKIDGSQIRAEWSRKKGWFKFGSKGRLLDETDELLGPARPLFVSTLAAPLARIAKDKRMQNLIVFMEFWGARSFAGNHEAGDPKFLTVFDASADKRALLPSGEFRRLFEGQVNTPSFLGRFNWTRGFVERVRSGDVPGITFEGVVGKGPKGVMAKAKTQAWIDKVKAVYKEDAARIIDS